MYGLIAVTVSSYMGGGGLAHSCSCPASCVRATSVPVVSL